VSWENELSPRNDDEDEDEDEDDWRATRARALAGERKILRSGGGRQFRQI